MNKTLMVVARVVVAVVVLMLLLMFLSGGPDRIAPAGLGASAGPRMSPAAKLYVIERGREPREDDPLLRRMEALVQRLRARCSEDSDILAGAVYVTIQELEKVGVNQLPSDVLQGALNVAVVAPGDVSCAAILAHFQVMCASTGDAEAAWDALGKVALIARVDAARSFDLDTIQGILRRASEALGR